MRIRLGVALLFVSLLPGPAQGQDPAVDGVDLAATILNQLQRPNLAATVQEITQADQLTRRSPFGPENPDLTSVGIGRNRIEIEVNGRKILVPGTAPAAIESTPAANPGLPADATQAVRTAIQTAQLYQQFSTAVTDFHAGRPTAAVQRMQPLEQQFQTDAVLSQAYSLFLFQAGDAKRSSEWLYHSISLKSQLFSWKDINQFYGDSTAYARQYTTLQRAAETRPAETSLAFLTACHHLSLGHHAHAKILLDRLPNRLQEDQVIQWLRSQSTQNPSPPQPISR